MLLGFILFLTALAVLVGMSASYGRRHLTSLAGAAPYEDAAAMQLPWLKLLLIATPFYFAAMYWTSVTYGPVLTGIDLAGLTQREVLRRPYMPLLDSKIAALAPDYFFEDVADSGGKDRSNILIYEDGKLLGPPHTSLYEVAVLGMGRYAHWKGNYSVFAFSSSDNTDPNTNGRVYTAERPRSK